jgi:hypothetical protein
LINAQLNDEPSKHAFHENFKTLKKTTNFAVVATHRALATRRRLLVVAYATAVGRLRWLFRATPVVLFCLCERERERERESEEKERIVLLPTLARNLHASVFVFACCAVAQTSHRIVIAAKIILQQHKKSE